MILYSNHTSFQFRPAFGYSWLIFLILFLLSGNISGQATNDVDPSLSHDRNALAPVRVDGSILFYVRGVSSFPAETRAKTIAQRIQRAAANYTKPPDSVKVIEDAGRLKVYAGNEFVMNIYSADAEAEGITPSIMAEIVVEKIKGIIKQYRHERSPDVIKSNALKALVALALLIIGLVAFSWLFRKLSDFFKRRLKNRIDTLENVSYKLIQANQLTKILHVLYQTVRVLILLIITVGFVDYILGLFPWTKAASIYLLELILDPLKIIGQGFIGFVICHQFQCCNGNRFDMLYIPVWFVVHAVAYKTGCQYDHHQCRQDPYKPLLFKYCHKMIFSFNSIKITPDYFGIFPISAEPASEHAEPVFNFT